MKENELPCPHCGKPITLMASEEDFENMEPQEQDKKIKKEFDSKNLLKEY